MALVRSTPNTCNNCTDRYIAHEGKHSGLSGLKRLGTVLGRRRQSAHPYGRASSPERKSSSNLGAAFGGFGKGKSKERDAQNLSPDRPVSPARRQSTPRPSDASGSPKQTRKSNNDRLNGTASPEPPIESIPGPSTTNGTTQDSIPELREPLSPPPAAEQKPDVCYTPLKCCVEADQPYSLKRMQRAFPFPPRR